MRVEQEKIPSASKIAEKSYNMNRDEDGNPTFYPWEVEEAMKEYLKLHLKAIRYEYAQYQFFLDGYRNGSASISEVREAHDKFTKLLDYEPK